MATTTNYSWTTPDDTALVKDGAAAIRSLGTAIDTTVFNNAGAAINKTIIDAAGDLIYGTAADTTARLALGTSGQLLRVNSGATAPEWATISTGGMTLISTTTLTGASITLSSIPATYNSLYIIVRDCRPDTDQTTFRMQFNADATASRHERKLWSETSGTTTFSQDQLTLTGDLDNTVVKNQFVIEIPDYSNTTTWKQCVGYSLGVSGVTTTSAVVFRFHGVYNQSDAISSLKFFMSGGNFTSGTVYLYGVK